MMQVSGKSLNATETTDKSPFDYGDYWNKRLNNLFDIEGVGYYGIGRIYNQYLYKTRLEILEYMVSNIFSDLKQKKVLEIGPGIGFFTEYFYHQRLKKYYAIDIGQKAIEFLKEKYPSFQFNYGDIADESMYENNEKYDLIFGANVLLHITEDEAYQKSIRNLFNRLEEGGSIILFDTLTNNKVKLNSPHVIIRKIDGFKKVIDGEGMVLAGIIPVFFFVNYPYDDTIVNDLDWYKEIFNEIRNAFSSEKIPEKNKKILAEYIHCLDRLAIIKFKNSLSEKVFIIGKQNTIIPKVMNPIWKKEELARKCKFYREKLNKTLIADRLKCLSVLHEKLINN